MDIADVKVVRQNEVARGASSADDQYMKIAKAITGHRAIKVLDDFGKILAEKPLQHDERAIFFATVWAFFKDVPSGIIGLAARVTDDWMRNDPWNGSAKAAHILYASVDEYGLHQHAKHMLPTHHHLFLNLITHLGLSDKDIFDPKYVLPQGTAMGNNTHRMYRSDSIGEALGFHLASEMTSSREFQYFYEGFKKYTESYKLEGEDDPVLSFFAIHCDVEPMHVATGRDILVSYINKDPAIAIQAMKGAIAFMDGFEQMFEAINNELKTSI
jgi:hypothetical protein